MHQEKQRVIVDARQAGAETTLETKFVVLAGDVVFFRLPFDAKWRIGQHVVKAFIRVTITVDKSFLALAGTQGIAENDVRDLFVLDHQVRAANGVRLRVVFLAKKLKVCAGIEAGLFVTNQLVRFGQHATGAAGGIVDIDDLAILVHKIVMGEQNADHQPDDFAWREVITGLFVGLFVETTNQVFEQIAHLDVRDAVRMEIDGRNFFDDLK